MRTWYVYELHDQITDLPFYIGMTGNIASTMARHWDSGYSAAQDRCRELRAAGYQLDLRVISTFQDRKEALAEEGRLIQSLPGLVNKTHKPRKPKQPRFVIILPAEHRVLLEQMRQRRGLRSEAEVIRQLIEEAAAPKNSDPRTWPSVINTARGAGVSPGEYVEHVLGRPKAPPGSRLKKR